MNIKRVIIISVFVLMIIVFSYLVGCGQTVTNTNLTTTTVTITSSTTTSTTSTTTTSTTSTTTSSTTTTTIDISQYLSWTYVTEQIYWSSPSIGDDGTVYIGSSYQLTTGSADALYAINSDGSLKWEYETGIDSPIRGAPVIGSDGTIYCMVYVRGDTNTHLYAINSDGTFKWKYQNLYETISPSWGELTPALSTQEVICAPGGNNIYAIGAEGTLLWQYPTAEAGPSFSSPSIGSDGTIYSNTPGGVYAINSDGSLKWKYETGTNDYAYSPPALGSLETIYVGRGSQTAGNTYVYALNSADGALLWRFYTEGLVVMTNPAVGSDGTIYVGTTSKGPAAGEGQCGIFFAINPDGTEKWSYDTAVDLAAAEENAQSDIYSSPAIGSDGTIYFSSESRFFYALNPDGTVKQKYDMYAISPPSSGCSTIAYSSPAIAADGTIYVGDYYYTLANDDSSAEGAVYALKSDSNGLADSPWPRIHNNNENSGRQD